MARALLWICFAASGAAALALESLWMRSATLVIGSGATTTAAVLAWYFAGLGIGAMLGRRGGARPIRRYGMLEIGAAFGTLWSLASFVWLGGDVAQAWLADVDGPRALLAVGIATLPATFCYGATLPALAHALLDVRVLGRRGGLLQAVNTLGGAAGLALAGFGLPAAIGVRSSYVVVALTSALAGAIALLVSGTAGDVGAERDTRAKRRAELVRLGEAAAASRMRVVAFVAGALGIGLEVLWTRLFAQVLHNSVYSFTAVALAFVLALAAGAAVASVLLRRLEPRELAAGALGAAGALTLGGFWLFMFATQGLDYQGMRSGLGEYVLRILALAAVTAGPAAFASGALLPALWAAPGRRGMKVVGDLAAANTFGAIAGALAAGFVVVPLLGLRGGVLLAVAGYVTAAHAIAAPGWRFRSALYVLVVVAVVADPLRAPIASLLPGVETLRALHEGPTGVTSVVDVRGNLQLRLDNYYVLGGSEAAANERRLGLLPLLLHPDPRRALFIGLATGITASAAPALGVADTTVAELVPEVATAARTHFAEWNGSLLDRTDVHLVVDDGRRALQSSRDRYDVIVSDLFVPWHAGTTNLYAREMYETAARRLRPGGLFCQWLPLYQLTRDEFDVIVRTFLTAFPRATLWRDDFYPNRPVVGLVGRLEPRPIDVERAAARAADLPAWAHDPLLAAPRGLAMFYVGDLRAIADELGAAPVNSDDRPVIEFLAPRLTRMGRKGDKDWFVGEALAAFYEHLLARDPGVTEVFAPAVPAVVDARRAGYAMVRYTIADANGDATAAARLRDEVRESVPEVIAAADARMGDADAEILRDDLSKLRSEQGEMRRHLDAMERNLERLDADGGTPPPPTTVQ